MPLVSFNKGYGPGQATTPAPAYEQTWSWRLTIDYIIKTVLPEKRRKDAVLAIEYLVTASPGDMKLKSQHEQILYFTDSLIWLKERHGQNVFYAGLHFDETTPHLFAYAVPLDPDTGRLNAKKWLGGPQALSEMQTDFAEKVGAKHQLERGILGSRAKHQTIKHFYGALASPPVPHGNFSEANVTSRSSETPAQVAARLTRLMQAHYGPAILEASDARFQRQRAAEMARLAAESAKQAKAAQIRLLELENLLEGLDQDRVAEIMELAREELRLTQSRPKGG